MIRGQPQPPIQVRARDLILRLLPNGMERAFVLRWLEPRAVKAQKRTELKAAIRLSPIAQAKDKIKRASRTALNRADDAFSILVRTIGTRPGGPDGLRWGCCVTCGKAKTFSGLQAGHFVGRKHFGTRWDLQNVKPQCPYCNDPRYGNGRPKEFREHLDAIYGPGTADGLFAHARLFPRRPSRAGLLELEEKFIRQTREALENEAGK